MQIIVCVKQVAETTEADLVIDEERKRVKEEDLPHDINEWDNYALEEALLLQEKFGGEVTCITIGGEETTELLRMCLAKGATHAIRIHGDPSALDGYAKAQVLARAIGNREYDLIFTGVQTSDDSYAQTGVALAELLGIPHVAVVTSLEITNTRANLTRELEGSLEEKVELSLPAVLTIQSGINEPRYASIMGIRRAAAKEIKILELKDLVRKKPKSRIEKLYIPVAEKKAELLTGSPDDTAGKLATIIAEKGLVK